MQYCSACRAENLSSAASHITSRNAAIDACCITSSPEQSAEVYGCGSLCLEIYLPHLAGLWGLQQGQAVSNGWDIVLAAGVRQVAGAVPSAAGQKAAQMQALQASGNMPWLLQERWPLLRCQLVRLCSQSGRQRLPCHRFMLRAMQRCLKLQLTGVLCSL